MEEFGNSGGVNLDIAFGFNDPNFSDRTLLLDIIGQADADAPPVKTIHVNSLILAASSPFFYKLLTNGMQESDQKHVTLQIEALERVSFMNLLKYIYSNNLPTTSNALLDLLVIADKFEVRSCLRDCTRALQNLPMTCESASGYLTLPPSVLMSPAVEPHIDAAKQYLVEKFKYFQEFDEGEKMLNLPLLGFQAVISSDDLEVTSEIVVYELVLEWARIHYPELEERREILKTHLLHLIRFPFMTTKELIDNVQTCEDIDPEVNSKIVIRALSFKAETSSHQRRCITTHEDNGSSRQYVERAYIYTPVKVTEFELPHPHCVVYFDLKRDALEDMFPAGNIWTGDFHLGEQQLDLCVRCYKSKHHHYFGVDINATESATSRVEYEFSRRTKPDEEFVSWFAGSRIFAYSKNLHCEGWSRFISIDRSYFINGFLHVRAVLSIKK